MRSLTEIRQLPVLSGRPIPIPWDVICGNLVCIARCYRNEANKLNRLLKRQHKEVKKLEAKAEANEDRAYEEDYFGCEEDWADCASDIEYDMEVRLENIELLTPFVGGFEKVTSAFEAICQTCKDEKRALFVAVKLECVVGQGRALSARYEKPNPREPEGDELDLSRLSVWKMLHATVGSDSIMTQIIETLQLGAVLASIIGGTVSITGQLSGKANDATLLESTMPLEMEAPGSGSIANVDEVIQKVEHVDAPAIREEVAASLMVRTQEDEDFARLVEKQLANSGEEPGPCSQSVYLISFRSGKGELFRKMLLQDAEFKHIRKSLKHAGYPIVLEPSKSIVLVHPDQYLDTMSALANRPLKRYNVIVAGSVEYLMDQVLLRMASKQRPRENRKEREELDLFLCRFVEKRSFLCESPKLLMAGTVAQSTTEAVRSTSGASSSYFTHTRGNNPRRFASDFSLGLGK